MTSQTAAIITGASQGFGAAVAERFLAEGAALRFARAIRELEAQRQSRARSIRRSNSTPKPPMSQSKIGSMRFFDAGAARIRAASTFW